MKKLIPILMFVAALAGLKAAYADSLAPKVVEAEIMRVEMDPSFPGGESIIGGFVRVNYEARTVRLTLERKFHCPPGRLCAMVMPHPVVIELPITDIRADRCGGTYVTAMEDKRPVDGAFQEIRVSDRSARVCGPTRGFDTHVMYTVETSGMGGQAGKAISEFDAMRLEPVSIER